MEITSLTIYIISKLAYLGKLCTIISAILFAAWGFITLASMSDVSRYSEEERRELLCVKSARKALKFAIALLVVGTIMPSRTELGAMYIIPPIVNNQEIKGLSEDVLKSMRGAAHEWVLSFVDKKKEEK